jgi:hypothetical protein
MTDLERIQGIMVRGIQQEQDGAHVLCTDPKTGTTFVVHPGETIGVALGRVKARYRHGSREVKGSQN